MSQDLNIVAESPGFRTVLDLARRVANSTANVLISGESGTGKEVVARLIHESGSRRQGNFVAINCAAIPESLLEAELFGHSKGAFTGAIEKRSGLFEQADGGTLFLDEIGDMSLPLQAKLLRVLQDRKIKRVGENRMRSINLRLLAATHRDLKNEVQAQNFREDLFFRLNVIPLHIPALRERQEDILPLSEFFLKRFSISNGITMKSLSNECVATLLHYSWPGNVRELENTIERAVVLAQGEQVTTSDLMMESSRDVSRPNLRLADQDELPAHASLDEVVREHILRVLDFNKGAKDKTAKMLGVDRKTLYRKLNEYGHRMAQG